jgi:hypothetical protein
MASKFYHDSELDIRELLFFLKISFQVRIFFPVVVSPSRNNVLSVSTGGQ